MPARQHATRVACVACPPTGRGLGTSVEVLPSVAPPSRALAGNRRTGFSSASAGVRLDWDSRRTLRRPRGGTDGNSKVHESHPPEGADVLKLAPPTVVMSMAEECLASNRQTDPLPVWGNGRAN